MNHNSHVDPFAYAHFQYNTGRVPRFLAKDGLFKKGFVGAVMRETQGKADPKVVNELLREKLKG